LLKPTLVFLFEDPAEPRTSWPEFAKVEAIDVPAEIGPYRHHGMAIWCHENTVVSLPEGSEHALEMVLNEACYPETLAVSVRRRPGLWVDWWNRLNDVVRRGVGIAEHIRHEVLEVIALRHFKDAMRSLENCADLVRGEGIDPSPEAMRTEKALSRAIDSLRASGFRAPRNR
jgi:hypothetical protein